MKLPGGIVAWSGLGLFQTAREGVNGTGTVTHVRKRERERPRPRQTDRQTEREALLSKDKDLSFRLSHKGNSNIHTKVLYGLLGVGG